MITSIPSRNEVKQILQTIYEDEEITDEMIDDCIEGVIFFAKMTQEEINDLFLPEEAYEGYKVYHAHPKRSKVSA